MNRLKWLVAVNQVLFLSVFLQIATGVMLFFDMFISRSELISRVHAYNGFLFAGLLVMHLALNWGWIKSNFFKRRVEIR
jgi:hypothetical protein